MNVSKKTTPDGITALRLYGKCVSSSVSALQAALNELTESDKKIMLDLKNINIVDSSAMGFLVDSVSKIEKRGGQLVLCNAQSFVKRLLLVSELDKVLELYGSETEAIAALKGELQKV